MSPRVLFVTGPPCSGKSSLAAWLSAYYRVPVLETDRIKSEAPTLDVAAEWIAYMGSMGHDSVIVDGLPVAPEHLRLVSATTSRMLICLRAGEPWKRWYARGGGNERDLRARMVLWADFLPQVGELSKGYMPDVAEIHDFLRPGTDAPL